ncbi:MAG: GNAT family N-acetyltransferase [Myxococcales bacterium]|jgi:CelD/BcsL family acetyltransferase involved in cellulose biosynthesis|nr:GNAT family N-acetyltransferase [Myxococcales bacterium]
MRRVDERHASRFSKQLWFDEVADAFGFSRLRAEWNGLHRCSRQSPFLSWDWLYPWWRRLSPESALRVFTLRDSAGHLRGLLPLCERRLGLTGARRWGFLGDTDVGSDGLDLVCLPEERSEFAARFADLLVENVARFDVLELLDLPSDTPLIAALRARFPERRAWVEEIPRYRCPRLDLQGSWDEFLQGFGRADNLKRRRRWFERQEGFAIERAEQPAALRGALETFFDLHAQRWQADGGSQGIDRSAVRAFHRDAVALFAESGLAHVHTLRLGTRALASLYGLTWDGRFYFYQSGFDPAFSRLSAGLVLMGETVAHSFQRGLVAYEFLRGEERYKFDWANAETRTVGLSIVPKRLAGVTQRALQMAIARLKGSARSMLGDERWQSLQRWRRLGVRRLRTFQGRWRGD